MIYTLGSFNTKFIICLKQKSFYNSYRIFYLPKTFFSYTTWQSVCPWNLSSYLVMKKYIFIFSLSWFMKICFTLASCRRLPARLLISIEGREVLTVLINVWHSHSFIPRHSMMLFSVLCQFYRQSSCLLMFNIYFLVWMYNCYILLLLVKICGIKDQATVS